MKAHRVLIVLLLFAVATGLVLAGDAPPKDPPPKDPKPKEGDEGAQGQDPPAEENPAPKKGDPGLKKILLKIKAKLAGKNREAQFKAVEELLAFDCPTDPATVKEISTVLTLAVNKLRGSFRQKCAVKFTEIGKKCPDAGIPEKVKAILRMMERGEGKNADVHVCLAFFDYLLSIEDADAEKIVGGFLGLLNDYQNVFHLLLKYSREGTLKIIADIANDTKNKNLIKRRHATTFLGFWGNGPPLYKVRVPALLKAMKSPVTSPDALKSIRNICLPDHTKPARWDRWWKRNEKEGLGDIEIIKEDIKDAYERQRGKQKKLEGALAIAEWIRDWNSSRFKWALPVLLNPLMKPEYNDKDLRARVISILGGIGELSALEHMAKILKETKGEKRTERALMGDIIRNMARIAGKAPEDVRKATGQALVPYLDNLFEGVVEAAAEAMGLLKYKDARDKLIGVITTGTKPRAALKAAEALGHMQAKKALEPLLVMLSKCLEDKDFSRTDLAYHIIKALRLMNVRSPEVVTHLIQGIGSGDERVALEAIALLGVEWKEKDAVAPIRLFFEDEERNLAARIKALKAIAAYPPEQAAETMFVALRKPSVKTFTSWLEARKRKNESAIKKLGEQVKAGQNFFKIASVYFIKDGNILPVHQSELIAIAKDEDANKEGRASCVRWLGKVGVWNEDNCLSYMIRFLEAKDVVVVEAARDVLKQHRTMNSLEILIKALPSPAPKRASWQEMQKLDVVRDFIFHSNQFNFEDPPKTPDFGFSGKDWFNWWKKIKHKFKFHEEGKKK